MIVPHLYSQKAKLLYSFTIELEVSTRAFQYHHWLCPLSLSDQFIPNVRYWLNNLDFIIFENSTQFLIYSQSSGIDSEVGQPLPTFMVVRIKNYYSYKSKASDLDLFLSLKKSNRFSKLMMQYQMCNYLISDNYYLQQSVLLQI